VTDQNGADAAADQAGGTDQAGERAEQERVVSLLGGEWSVIAGLLAGFGDEQWSLRALPGWTVHDVLAHLIGTERTLSGAELPQVPAGSASGEHVRNDIARLNEAWVVTLRELSHADLLEAFRQVTAQRVVSLRAMTPAEFNAPSWTPAGNATYARFMKIRTFDCWMHEQDIRAVTGVPGNESGPIAEQALEEVTLALGYIVGKRGRAPDGSTVSIRLTGPVSRDLHVVVDGRARLAPAIEGEPTASITLPSSLFLRLAGGREDASAALSRIELGGDVALGTQVATNLAYTI
jgi:uncharacterized protein (TIGR03083 family)